MSQQEASSLIQDRDIWDRIGISLSGICLIHCLAFPVVLSLLPMWASGDALHDWLHPVFAILLVPTTIFAWVRGLRVHGRKIIGIPLAIGLVLVVAASVVAGLEAGEATEVVITSLGSVLLVIGHFANWREGRRICDASHVTG